MLIAESKGNTNNNQIFSKLKRPLSDNGQLFFIHIPKSAGTTFIGILDTRFSINNICPVHWPFEKLLGQISFGDLKKYDFIRGHFPFSLIYQLDYRPICITFLRDPVERMISEFEQLKLEPQHHLHDILKSLSLEEFLNRKEILPYFVNKATRYFGGEPYTAHLAEQIPNLDLAKENLESIEYFGITERFADSLDLFCFTFDLPMISSYETKNVSPNRESRRNIPRDLLEYIVELNQIDIQFYQYGLNLFEQRIQVKNEEENNPDIVGFQTTYVKSHFIDFRLVPPGAGWHVGEYHEKYGYIRWSGSETESKLFMYIDGERDYIIRFRILQAISAHVLENLQMFVNKSKIDIHRLQEGSAGHYIFEGRIPSNMISTQQKPTQLSFLVIKTIRASEIILESKDIRKLGVCFDWIHVYPA
jgi:hypothetical protein